MGGYLCFSILCKSVQHGDPSSVTMQQNKKITQAPGRINKGWAKLRVLKCGRERWFFYAYLLSKNTAMPTQRTACPQRYPCQYLLYKAFWLVKSNEHPETFNYRFSTNEVNKASNAAQNKACDEKFHSGNTVCLCLKLRGWKVLTVLVFSPREQHWCFPVFASVFMHMCIGCLRGLHTEG